MTALPDHSLALPVEESYVPHLGMVGPDARSESVFAAQIQARRMLTTEGGYG